MRAAQARRLTRINPIEDSLEELKAKVPVRQWIVGSG